MVDKLNYKIIFVLSFLIFTRIGFGQSNPCSGLRLQLSPNFALEQDSLLYGCAGDSLVIVNTSYDTSGQNLSHSWTVYGKGTIFNQDFRDSFAAGKDSILITITNDSGCTLSQKFIYHIINLETKIWVNDSAQCMNGNAFTFRDSSRVNLGRGLIDSVRWWIPNVLSKNELNFNHSFQQDSFYRMNLATYTRGGCADTGYMPLSIHASPIAGINYLTDTVTCYIKGITDTIRMSSNISLSNRTGASISTKRWVVSLLESYAVDTFTYVFDPLSGGTYGAQNFKFEVTADNGCSADSVSNVYVVEPVSVAANLSNAQVCKGNPLQLNVTTNFDSKDPARSSYLVFDGDTTYFSADSLVFYKNDTGTFDWKLVQTTVGGCVDSVVSTASVSPTPIALLSSSDEVLCTLASDTIFLGSVGILGSTESRNWYVNDTFYTSDSLFKYVPDYVGLSQVKLKISNTAGCADSMSITAGIAPTPVGAIQRVTTDSCLSDLQTFKAVNKGASAVKSATWTFSDNTQLSDTVVSRRFSTSGAQSITLSIEDEYGCKDTSVLTTNIAVSPKARFVASAYSACVYDQKFTFYDSSTTSSGTLGNKSWIMSDGTTITNSSASSINKVFNTGALQYSVKLAVVNSFGCKDTFTDFVYVYPRPSADFNIDVTAQCLTGNTFGLTNTSVSNTASQSLNYYWDFGDSTSSILKSPTKSYSSPGSYTMKLYATSLQGCSDSVSYGVTVLGQPEASFSINNSNQCIDNNSFQLAQTSTVFSGGSIVATDWTFSDGSTKTGSTTTKTFSSAGSYTIMMKSRSSNGCYDSMIKSVSVLPKPKAQFTVNKDTQCFVGNSFQFDNSSSIVPGGGGLTYNWSFGDTTTSTAAHPNVSYTSYGNFTVQLTAESQYGCKDVYTFPIQVTASPQVNFTSTLPLAQCNKVDTFKLTNNTVGLNGTGLSYNWKMGDGNSYSSQNISHSYSKAGSYFVKLVASNSIGCSDSLQKKVVVYPDPEVSFTVNQLNQCFSSQDFQFSNSTTVGFNGGTLTYQWKVRDSIYSTSNNSSIKFKSEGSYPIKLVTLSSNGCKDSAAQVVTVLPTPQADFIVNTANQCLSTNSYSFTNLSVIQGGTLTYNWDFGDSIGSNLNSPKKVYTSSGDFDVQLVAVSNRGCTDTVVKQMKVYSMPVSTINLSDSALCLSGNTFNISQSSSNSDGSSLSYNWDFGDSTKSTGTTTSKSYKKSGVYLLRLITETANGCKDSFKRNIEVYAQPYSAFSVNRNNQCLSGNAYSVKNISQVKGNKSLTYAWSFGNSNSSNSKEPTWNYSSSGNYYVTLQVESSDGCRDTFIDTMVVYNQPSVDFDLNANDHCLRGNLVELTNKSTISGATLNYDWSFGDGKGSIGTNPQTIYSNTGTYRIKLIVTTSKSCKDSVTKTVTIHPNPVSDFTINSAKQCLNTNNYSFTNNTTIGSGNYTSSWLFGDGNTSTTGSPTNKYSQTGDYVVTLISTSDKGCTDTLRKDVTIWPDPVAYFEINDSIQCENNNDFVYFNYSKIASGTVTGQWNYGDGTVKNQFNGGYSYSNAGKYEVTLYAESNFGCIDSMKKWVVVTSQPKAAFTLNDADQCLSYNNFEAVNNSVYNGTETVNYYWDISNGDRVNSTNLKYSFTEFGNYEVKLVGVTSEGCKDSLIKPAFVYPQGKSDIRILNDSFCLRNNLVTIGNDSRVDGDRFAAIRWEFGDGTYNTIASLNPIKHSYNSSGVFKVLLITTTSSLCKDTSEGTIYILDMPSATLSVNETVSCFNEQKFEFTDISNTNGENWDREWIMERRVVSTDAVLNYNFKTSGNLLAQLVQINANGCTDTAKQEILVNPSPEADFVINLPNQCLENNEYYFINTSKGSNNAEGLWLPEPGVATFEINYLHNYFYDGNYDVSLTVYTDSGCSDEISKPVTVHPTPQGFISKTNACVNDPIVFDPNSSINSGYIKRYDWTLGDGTYSSDSSPVHKYILSNTYNLTLKMTSDQGCVLSMQDYVDVYPKPQAGVLVYTERPTILKPEVEFWDSLGGNAFWEWDFGDFSSPGVMEQEFHTYEDTGNFNVRLVVTNYDGCTDTAYRIVRIWPAFKLLYPTAFSPNDDGINDDYNILGKFHSIVDAKIAIYNSVGILVYESNDITEGWNGRYMNNGDPLPVGNYELVVSIRDMYNEQFSFTKKISIVR